MAYGIEVIFALTISIWSADTGEMEDVNFYWATGTHKYCNNLIACYYPESNDIWLNLTKLDRKDTCGRDPWTHEVLHVIYGKNIQSCDLKIYKGMINTHRYG